MSINYDDQINLFDVDKIIDEDGTNEEHDEVMRLRTDAESTCLKKFNFVQFGTAFVRMIFLFIRSMLVLWVCISGLHAARESADFHPMTLRSPLFIIYS